MKITITLEQLDKFLKKLKPDYTVRHNTLFKLVPILEKSLRENVFRRPHSDTSKIESKDELKALIRTGSNHVPASARSGKQYNEEYLARKRRLGEVYPHKYMEYGFWMGTEANKDAGSVVMKTAKPTDPKKFGRFKKGDGDYLSYHETQRSVLKRAFLMAWQNIIDEIIESYAKEAQK